MFRLNPPSCFPLVISTQSGRRRLHEAEQGARPQQQCTDYSYFFSSPPHMMVRTRKTQGFIHQLCWEPLIVSLLKEVLETRHRPAREEREQGETQREVKS